MNKTTIDSQRGRQVVRKPCISFNIHLKVGNEWRFRSNFIFLKPRTRQFLMLKVEN
ncbi:hypothetical protein SOV_28800 [Sporomusa ovata DSM 2662]|nr:hypothetical protein SOV_7c00640 [Sporomusa ovata DSM 2662]